jgi:hypothetical protein
MSEMIRITLLRLPLVHEKSGTATNFRVHFG